MLETYRDSRIFTLLTTTTTRRHFQNYLSFIEGFPLSCLCCSSIAAISSLRKQRLRPAFVSPPLLCIPTSCSDTYFADVQPLYLSSLRSINSLPLFSFPTPMSTCPSTASLTLLKLPDECQGEGTEVQMSEFASVESDPLAQRFLCPSWYLIGYQSSYSLFSTGV